MTALSRFAPWAIVGCFTLYLIGTMMPPADPPGGMKLHEAGRLPVMERGRIKPLDTLARTQLMLISNRQEFKDENGRTQPAIKWLFDVATSRPPDRSYRIENAKLQEVLGLPARDSGRYALEEFYDKYHALTRDKEQVMRLAKEDRETLDALLGLAQQVAFDNELDVSGQADVAAKQKVFRIENDQLLGLLGLEPRPGSFRYALAEFQGKFQQLLDRARQATKVDEKLRDVYDVKTLELFNHLQLYVELNGLHNYLVVAPEQPGGEWQKFRQGVIESVASRKEKSNALAVRALLRAYAAGKPEEFNKALDDYRQRVAEVLPEETRLAGLETFFNHFEPFYQCSVLYVFVFILACVSWVAWTDVLSRAAFWLAAVTLAVHSGALVTRMYLQGRPPVTNLYSSAVFIGWGCVLLCLVLEWLYRNGIGTALAAVTGALTMVIAHHLGGSGDTLEMMQAVLDTNFWLATHVTCVTLGYTATFVAGFLGIVYIGLGFFTRGLDRDLVKTLSQMIYGVVCFATLLSFVGTVLGGIWADQSWGRFWGWDPKENGALLIVMWNALILHARWAGMVKQRGMAVLAVAGNMVTGWSWFGTNQLGVGLHAYGFNNTLATGLTVFWASQLLIIGLGMLPERMWGSFRLATPNPGFTPGGRKRPDDVPVGALR